MKKLISGIQRFLRDEEGATAIEYGLIAALISVVIMAAVALIGTRLNTVFCAVANRLGTAGSGC